MSSAHKLVLIFAVVSSAAYAHSQNDQVFLVTETMNITEDFSGDVKIFGEVRNDTNFTLKFVEVIFTFRDSTGKILGLENTFVDGDTVPTSFSTTDTGINPLKSAPFDLFTNVVSTEVDTFEVRVSYGTVEERIKGDLDDDGDVDFQDFLLFADNFGKTIEGLGKSSVVDDAAKLEEVIRARQRRDSLR